MNQKAFFVDALGGALELGLATPDDVLRHVTPDVLAKCLPRPLWARLLTACLGAPRVDAQLVIETIGVPNLCEHVPGALIWECIAEIAARSLGKEVAPAAAASAPAPAPASASGPSRAAAPLVSPPPEADPPPAPLAPAPAPPGPNIPSPLADLIDELEGEEKPFAPARARPPTQQRFRPSATGVGRLGRDGRRPQAQAAASSSSSSSSRSSRRAPTDVSEVETETAVQGGDWRDSIAVEDSQLVDWQASEETQTSSPDDFRRKR